MVCWEYCIIATSGGRHGCKLLKSGVAGCSVQKNVVGIIGESHHGS